MDFMMDMLVRGLNKIHPSFYIYLHLKLYALNLFIAFEENSSVLVL